MNNKGLLAVIAVILLGIFGVLAMQYHESQKSPAEKIAEGVSDSVDHIGDELSGKSK